MHANYQKDHEKPQRIKHTIHGDNTNMILGFKSYAFNVHDIAISCG